MLDIQVNVRSDPEARARLEAMPNVRGGLGRQTARLIKSLGVTVHVLTKDGVVPKPHQYRIPGSGDPDGTLPDRVFVADDLYENH